MRITLIMACALLICVSVQTAAQTRQPIRRIVLAASTILDGRGHILNNTRIVVEGDKIVAIDPKASPVDYDLRGLTVLPGWIDAHAHITWSFGKWRDLPRFRVSVLQQTYRFAMQSPEENFPARAYSQQLNHSSVAAPKQARLMKSAHLSESRKRTAPT